MASYSLEEFLGEGLLKDLGSKFADDGWDDVPTIKVIGADDMETLELTDAQRDALELRIYLHNRSLMQYADTMETSGIGLIDLMTMKPADLTSKFNMRKAHVTTFVDTSLACGIQMPPDLELPPAPSGRRRFSKTSRSSEDGTSVPRASPPTTIISRPLSLDGEVPAIGNTSTIEEMDSSPADSSPADSSPRESNANAGFEPPAILRPLDAKKPNASKGVFSVAEGPRGLFGVVKAPNSGEVTKLATLEKISLQQLAPDHRIGVDPRSIMAAKKPALSFKASKLINEKPTLFFCIRRPGCVMCRAEAHQLYARKPIFDALGVQLVAVLLEDLDDEVWAFWPRYWAGKVVLDEKRDFFRALGGGKLMRDSLFMGFFLNPLARMNWKRATKTGIQSNTKGEGSIKGGLYIARKGRGGVAYQFAERNFGDWAPLDEILQVCHIIREEETPRNALPAITN